MSSETTERAKVIRAAFSVLGITEHGGYSPERQKAEDELAAILAEVARLEEHRSGLIKDHLRLRHELAAALEREQRAVGNLAKIAEVPCTLNLAGKCVGAVHSRRKRYDNPERVEIVGCAAHFARAVLVDEPAAATGSTRLLVRAADRLAAAVAHRIKVGHLDARSEAGDALLDYDSLNDHRAALGIAPREPAAATLAEPDQGTSSGGSTRAPASPAVREAGLPSGSASAAAEPGGKQ